MDKKFVSIAIKGEVKDGYVTVVRYDRSFIARIIQNDAAKAYYSEIKNHCLSLGMRSRISWKGDAFYLGRKSFLIAKVRGRTLTLYLALDPAAYDEKIYHHLDVSGIKSYENCPMMIRVRSDLALRKAKKLISEIAENAALTPKDRARTDYVAELPYEETDALIVKGLVKEVESVMKAEEAEKAIAEAEKKEEDEEVIFELAEEEEDAAEEEADAPEKEEPKKDSQAEESPEEEEWVDFELAEEDEDEDEEEVVFELAEEEDEEDEEPSEEAEEEPEEVVFDLVEDLSGEMEAYSAVDREGRYVTLKKYVRGFVARMKQGSVERRERYAAVKSAILSLENVKVRSSFSGETFMYGRQPLLKSRIRGKTLCLFLALCPEDYPASVYHQKDRGRVKAFVDTPMMIRVKSDLGKERALRLIAELVKRFSLSKGKGEVVRDEFFFEETSALVEKGLIKTRLITVPAYEAEEMLRKKEK